MSSFFCFLHRQLGKKISQCLGWGSWNHLQARVVVPAKTRGIIWSLSPSTSIPVPASTRLGFFEVFGDETFCLVGILSPDVVFETFSVRKIFFAPINGDSIEAPAVLEFSMLVDLQNNPKLSFKARIRNVL